MSTVEVQRTIIATAPDTTDTIAAAIVIGTRRFQRKGEPAAMVVEYSDGHTEIHAAQ